MEEKHSKGKVFKAVEQMVKRNRDVTGAGCIRNAKGKVVMKESELREVWRSHYEKLSMKSLIGIGTIWVRNRW